MPQRHCQNNCPWAWRLIYRSTSVGLNLQVAVPCLVDPLDSFGFQSCTAYGAKQRWNNGGEMSGNKQTLCANGSVFVHGHMHTVSNTCVNTCIDSAPRKGMQKDSCSWTVGDVCLWVQLSSPNDLSLIMSMSKHLLMEEKSQAQTTVNKSFTKGEKVSWFAKRWPPISCGWEISIWIVSHFQAERGRAVRRALWRETAASCKLESLCEKLLCPLLSPSSSPQSAGMQMSPLIPHV